jgi:hypothetical protein
VLPLELDDSVVELAVPAGTVRVCLVAGAAGCGAALPWEVLGVVLGAVPCGAFDAGAGVFGAAGAGVVAAGVLGAAGAGAVVVGVPGGGAKTAAVVTLGSARPSTASRDRTVPGLTASGDRTVPGLDAWVMEIERIAVSREHSASGTRREAAATGITPRLARVGAHRRMARDAT